MYVPKNENIVVKDGYLVDSLTEEKVVFYECDPAKNTECDKSMCRYDGVDNSRNLGGCGKTHNPAFAKDGGKKWYAVIKTPEVGEPYWGREYIEEV